MDSLPVLLASFGCNIAASTVYDWLTSKVSKKIKSDDLVKELARLLSCDGSVQLAEKIIQLMKEEKVIEPMTDLTGYVQVNANNAKDVIGAHITKPTIIRPGTVIETNVTGSADTITGLKIG